MILANEAVKLLKGKWITGPNPHSCHSPELALKIHKVLFGQHQAGAGVDDQGLAVLEVGCFEPPIRQLEGIPEPVRRAGQG